MVYHSLLYPFQIEAYHANDTAKKFTFFAKKYVLFNFIELHASIIGRKQLRKLCL